FFGFFEESADLRRDWLETADDQGRSITSLGTVLGVEDLAQRGGDQAALVAAAVREHVAHEVHGAALPAAAKDPLDRGLQSLVLVGRGELDAAQAALLERAQELDPEAARLDL